MKLIISVLLSLVLLFGCAQPAKLETLPPLETTMETITEQINPVPQEETPVVEETIKEQSTPEENISVVEEPEVVEEITTESEVVPTHTIIQPTKIYANAYNGPLYDTSLQIGGNGEMDDYFENFDRNGMNYFVGMFKIDYPPNKNTLRNNEGLGYLMYAVKKYPGRIVPYMSLSLPPEDLTEILGEEATSQYQDNIEGVSAIAGEDVVQGFGELEIMEYEGIKVDGPEMTELYELAKEKKINIMFHPKDGQAPQVKRLIEKYPEITFHIHMFPEDFDKDELKYIDLLKSHDNLYFSVDVDHMSFDGETGLLYKYQDEEVPDAVDRFVSLYDTIEDDILTTAIARYKPMIDEVPDKVMWGTEMGPKYNFEPKVYDRIIKFSRLFIGELDAEDREAFAYRNALRVFGEGVASDVELTIIDANDWPSCTSKQNDLCEEESIRCGEVESPAEMRCLAACFYKQQCLEDLEGD